MTGIAAAAQAAASARLAAYAAAPGVASRRGNGWFAVRTGVASNEHNGVVSDPSLPVRRQAVEGLVRWFTEPRVPACWMTSRPTPALTDVLVGAGARPERTGRWSGRPLPLRPHPDPAERLEVVPVSGEEDLDDWLTEAGGCGWYDDDAERAARRRLYLGLGAHHPTLAHWVARADGRPVGFASTFLHGDVVDLWNVGVDPTARRRGVGRALIQRSLTAALHRGATAVVSAPSPEGWQLQRALGFTAVAVEPDTTFYLPT